LLKERIDLGVCKIELGEIMLIFYNKSELKEKISEWKQEGQTIGFVPTMGFLHAGHVRLFEESARNNNMTIVSIFVNPAQFNDKKDFENYPKNVEADLEICRVNDVDAVYIPEVSDIYPDQEIPDIQIKIPHLMKNLCATTRPGHFEGVLLVISNLFHIVEPNKAYFGKKDFQQYLIIKEFVKYTNFPIEILVVNTVREEDGLAMSSRNARLSAEERKLASQIPIAFQKVQEYFQTGGKNIQAIKKLFIASAITNEKMKLDYLEILDAKTLAPISEARGIVLVACAVFCGEVRLIDNIIVRL
jgi:pantoate--beta-alanine ligase